MAHSLPLIIKSTGRPGDPVWWGDGALYLYHGRFYPSISDHDDRVRNQSPTFN